MAYLDSDSRAALTVNPWRGSEVSPEREVAQVERDDSDRNRSLSPTEYNTESNDHFYDDFSPQPPQRSATTPSPRHRIVNNIRFERGLENIHRQRRQSTHDTKYSVSFADTVPWDRKAILSLDGGGIRGYSALLILQELMNVIKNLERSHPDGAAESSYHPLPWNPLYATDSRTGGQADPGSQNAESARWLPCHYFDYIAGTSTGGLIGIMLGRLRMNIDDCVSDYEKLGDKVFGRSRWFHLRSPFWFPRDKYNHHNLEHAVKEVVAQKIPKIAKFPGGQNFAFDENRCRTVVLSYQQQTNEEAKTNGIERPYLFRTYKNLHQSESAEGRLTDRNPGPAHDIPIWWVARATSAAPSYFKPMKIHKLAYLDGGFGANNPCEEIFEEVRKMNNHADTCASIIISVGTGIDTGWSRLKNLGPSRFINFLNVARKWASESEEVHVRMLNRKEGAPFEYYRLNVPDGIGSLKLDEWRVRGRVRTTMGKTIGKLRSGRLVKSVIPKRRYHSVGEKNPEKSQTITSHVNGQHGALINGGERDHGNASSTIEPSAIPKWLQPRNKTLKLIRKHTEDYLRKPEVKEWIDEIAKVLVDGRRARAKQDADRWEKACFGAWYQCNVRKCPRAEKEYQDRHSLKKHFLDKHIDMFSRDKQEELEKALDDCKIVVH